MASPMMETDNDSQSEASAVSVRIVQAGLKQLGHDPGPLDNAWGQRTARAFIAWSQTTPARSDASAQPAEGGHSVFIEPPALISSLSAAAGRYAVTHRPASAPSSSTSSSASAAPASSFADKAAAFWSEHKWTIIGVGAGVGAIWWWRKRKKR